MGEGWQIPGMYHRLLVHIVWTTRDRAPTLDLPRARFLAENLRVIVRQERGHLLEVGIVTTHVHLLVRLHPTTSVPRLLQRLKGGTAHGVNSDPAFTGPTLRWAKGYGITSVSSRNLTAALMYVRHQSTRHPNEAIAGWPGEMSLATQSL